MSCFKNEYEEKLMQIHPEAKFDKVGCLEDPIAVKEKNVDGKHYFYAVNLEPYDIMVRFYLKKPATYKEICSGEKICENKNVFEAVIGAFSKRSFACEGENEFDWFSPQIPKEEKTVLTEAYKDTVKALEWAENEKITICGLAQTKEALIKAFTNFSPAKVRQIINGYVCLKARTLYKKG